MSVGARSDVTSSPMLLGRYEVLGALGRGSFGTVLHCRDRATGAEVAVKAFLPELGRGDGFLKELGLLFEVDHPNVVKMLSVFMEGGRRYLVYEYLEQGSLRQYMRSARFEAREGLRLVLDAARGVAVAHARGVVHRDLKPENILLTRRGGALQARVADFGIAALLSPGASRGKSTSGTLSGSPEYMAPEQFHGRHDERVDVYALGVMTYELVCGHRPFDGDAAAVAARRLRGEVELPDWLSPPLAELLRSALAREPSERCPSAQVFAGCLDRALGAVGEDWCTGGWPVALEPLARLEATSQEVLALRGTELLRFDPRGRLIHAMPNVSDVVACGSNFAARRSGLWVLTTPIAQTRVVGVPDGARVKISSKACLAFLDGGGAFVVEGSRVRTVVPAGSGAIDLAFSGEEQRLWVLVRAAAETWLTDGVDRRLVASDGEHLAGHLHRGELVVSLAGDRGLLLMDSDRERVEPVRCGPVFCDGDNFVALEPRGSVVSLNLRRQGWARTELDAGVASIAVAPGQFAWQTAQGHLKAAAVGRGAG